MGLNHYLSLSLPVLLPESAGGGLCPDARHSTCVDRLKVRGARTSSSELSAGAFSGKLTVPRRNDGLPGIYVKREIPRRRQAGK